MDNQHRQISGYRELDEAEITAMNEIKAVASKVEELVEKLQLFDSLGSVVASEVGAASVDRRWLAIGVTQLQQGFMALTRAVAQPTTF